MNSLEKKFLQVPDRNLRQTTTYSPSKNIALLVDHALSNLACPMSPPPFMYFFAGAARVQQNYERHQEQTTSGHRAHSARMITSSQDRLR
jgi:hypothetical protein